MATNNSINTGKPIEVTYGGTQNSSFTAYAPITGGTTSTGALQVASSGQSNVGYVLTSTGASSLPTWQVNAAPSAGGMILLSTQTANNVASVDFTSLLSSSYRNYVLVISNYLPVTDSTDLLVQGSDNNGASWSTGFYIAGSLAVLYNSSTWNNYYNAGGASGMLAIRQVHNTGVPANCWMTLYCVNDGTPNATSPQASASSSSDNALTGGYGFQQTYGEASQTFNFYPYTAIRAISSSGNIAQGTFSLYALAQ